MLMHNIKENNGLTKSSAIIIAIIILVGIIGAVWLQSSKYTPVTVGALHLNLHLQIVRKYSHLLYGGRWYLSILGNMVQEAQRGNAVNAGTILVHEGTGYAL